MPIIETAQGLAEVTAIAAAAPRISRLAFGGVDMGADLGLPMAVPDGIWQTARFLIALASRKAGLRPPVDTAFIDIRDIPGLETSVELARNSGFGGKFCIHPDQIAPVNRAFSPGPAETDRALRLVAAYETAMAAGSGAVLFEGVMLDIPVVENARKLLAQGA